MYSNSLTALSELEYDILARNLRLNIHPFNDPNHDLLDEKDKTHVTSDAQILLPASTMAIDSPACNRISN